MNYYDYARHYPPILVRLLARKRNGPALTTAEITQKMVVAYYENHGEPRFLLTHVFGAYTVNSISSELKWDTIEFGVMRAFLTACDMDFTDSTAMNRKAAYMRLKHKFIYLRKSPEFETVLKPLIIRYRAHIEKKINS